MKIKIENATPDMASHIASLIMEAMNAECCQNFAGPKHTLVDFHRMMTRLVEMEDSQYSIVMSWQPIPLVAYWLVSVLLMMVVNSISSVADSMKQHWKLSELIIQA